MNLNYPNKTDMKQFERIAAVSSYDSNYYIGLGGDLLYGKSDDDDETEWFLVRGSIKLFQLIGYSYCSKGDILEATETPRT